MPNINKVVYGNTTLIDLTDSTLSSASQLESGVTAYDRSGTKITGTASGGGSAITVTEEQLSGGGTAKHITAVDISNDTVDAAHLAQGYTAHAADGTALTGTMTSTAVTPLSVTQNGTYTAPTGTAYSPVTVNVSGGETPAKEVIFIDYDGTELYEYTTEEAQALSALPSAPTHSGLTFQEWNYTLQEVKATTVPLVVGANYITTDGKTKLYLTFLSSDDIDINLALYINSGATVTIDWGDGSPTETPTGTGNKSVPHSYEDKTYPYSVVINLTVTGTGMMELSYSSATNGILRGSTPNLTTTALRKVELGEKVNWINSNAFNSCSNLETISINNICRDFSSGNYGSFKNATSLKAVVFPIICRTTSSSSKPNALMGSCENLKYVTGAQNIPSSAFSGCYSLKMASFALPGTLFPSSAFATCRSLSSYGIPEGVTEIGSNAFDSCYRLKKVVIPNGVTTIQAYAFSNTALSEAVLPDSVTTIGNYAFNRCRSLVTITIPANVTSIGGYAFTDCYPLEIHVLPTTPPTLGTTAFGDIRSNCKIYVPSASLSDYQAATNWSAYASYMVGE